MLFKLYILFRINNKLSIIQNNSNNYNLSNNNNREELENCYPEIYKIVYPMVSQRCSTMSQPVTRETVENMTDEIYSAIEVNS